MSDYATSPLDGSRIFYRVTSGPRPEALEAADRSPPAIVLCDGVGCDGYVWKYLHPALAASYQVITWHYRGHGKTPTPQDRARVGIADHVADLMSILDQAGVEQAVLIGHSMGVQVALEALREHADRVAGLVLVCGSPGQPLSMTRNPERAELLLRAAQRAVYTMPWLLNGAMRVLLPTEFAYKVATWLEVDTQELLQADFMPYLHAMARIDLRLFIDTLAAANRHSAVDLLQDIEVPTLIIGGSDDGFTSPVLSQVMYDRIERSEMFIVERGTHTTPLEYPDLVCNRVLDFLHRRLI